MTRPVDVVLARLDRHKAKGHGQWIARCPAHDDRNPSLSIKEGENGAVLLKCFAGCDTAAVVAAMGLELSDLFPPRDSASRGSSVVQRNFTRPPGEPPQRETPAPEPQALPRLFTLTRYGEIERRPVDWLLQGYLARNTLAGLIAPPGACKSFLAVDWACRVATGTPWHGRPVKRGAVFYLAGEGQQGLAKRIEGWEIANGVSVKDAPLYISSGIPFLCEAANVQITVGLLEEVADRVYLECGLEPALIVIDTVARAMNGANENTAEDMGRFIAAKDALRQHWGATVLSVHHTGHNPDAQRRGRGSSNYGANLDSDFYLDSKGDTVLLTAGDKAKDWTTPPPVALVRQVVHTTVIGEDGGPETTLVLRDNAGAILATDKTKREKAVELSRTGLSEREIADQVGVSKTTVHRWLKEAA
jgi:RecA-family ATPase